MLLLQYGSQPGNPPPFPPLAGGLVPWAWALSVRETRSLSLTVGLSWDMDLDDTGEQDEWALGNI